MSTWRPNRKSLPTEHVSRPLDMVRINLQALAAEFARGQMDTWEYTNSVVRGEASPGTSAQPLRKYWKRGSGNTTIWIKAVISYDDPNGYTDKTRYYYSEDNESSYVPMLDENNNYVLSQTNDAVGIVQTMTWGNVP